MVIKRVHVFKHKDGGICKAYTPALIEKLRKNKDFTEVVEQPRIENKALETEVEEKISTEEETALIDEVDSKKVERKTKSKKE